MNTVRVLGVFLIVLGIAIKVIIARRKFYRRNAFGQEGFSSFRNAVTTSIGEKFVNFLATAMIAVGAFFCVIGWW